MSKQAAERIKIEMRRAWLPPPWIRKQEGSNGSSGAVEQPVQSVPSAPERLLGAFALATLGFRASLCRSDCYLIGSNGFIPRSLATIGCRQDHFFGPMPSRAGVFSAFQRSRIVRRATTVQAPCQGPLAHDVFDSYPR